MLLWDLSTLCVLVHLRSLIYIYTYIYIYISYIYIYDIYIYVIYIYIYIFVVSKVTFSYVAVFYIDFDYYFFKTQKQKLEGVLLNRCSWTILQISKENNYFGVSFSRPATLSKQRLCHRYFSVFLHNFQGHLFCRTSANGCFWKYKHQQ